MFSDLRTALWHLRKGGVKQLTRHLEYKERLRLEASTSEEDIATVETERRQKLRGFDPHDFPELAPNENRPKAFGNYRVGVILDDFSQMAWGSEFTVIQIMPDTWEESISDIDFLLVESAWQGNEAAWRYQVVGSAAPSEGLRELISWCQGHDVPTVFWNKEDPEHFEDFIDTAVLFDFVATTDEECVARYQEYEGFSGEVFVLPFAAQPSVHHPIRDQISARHQIGDVCFAGTYFRHKFERRREQMDLILNAGIVASQNLNSALTIYSRNEAVDEKYTFPEPFDDWVVDALPYSKMLAAYRGYKVFLNVNTVEDSSTMFSRRVLELLASGTAVVSTKSKGLSRFFSETEVVVVDEPVEAESAIESLVRSPNLRDRMVHRAQRNIWENHTYTHRAELMLSKLGLDTSNSVTHKPRVSVIMPTMRPELFESALAQIQAQEGVELEVLVATHGFKATEREYPNVRFFEFSRETSLGQCLNSLIERATGDYVAKMDDDDLYGPSYLRDGINALRYSGAAVVGKQASYLYQEDSDELILRKKWREHLWTDMVLGATLVTRRETFDSIKFRDLEHGEDTQFLKDVVESGGKIYSADRFNYIQVRGIGKHTWSVSSAELKRNGQVETFGLNVKHVFVNED